MCERWAAQADVIQIIPSGAAAAARSAIKIAVQSGSYARGCQETGVTLHQRALTERANRAKVISGGRGLLPAREEEHLPGVDLARLAEEGG